MLIFFVFRLARVFPWGHLSEPTLCEAYGAGICCYAVFFVCVVFVLIFIASVHSFFEKKYFFNVGIDTSTEGSRIP